MFRTNATALFLLTVFLFSSSRALAQANDPVAYMQSMSTELEKIKNDTWKYISTIAHSKSAKKIENRRKELIATTVTAKTRISKLPPFEGDASFRDSVLAFLKLNHAVLNEDYAKIVDMEEIAEQSYDAMEAYLLAQEKASEKLEKAGDMIYEQQKIFAAKHNITLLETQDKVSTKLESADMVMSYYNVIYLIFFKSYKQELYVIDAMNKGDVNAMEQNKNTLIKFATEGLAKLDTIKSFKGDITIKNACKALLDFYLSEANTKMPDLINYYLKKDNFEKTKAAFDAKPQSKRTQADIDQYNAALKEMNDAGTKFNSINQSLDTKRMSLIEAWNKAAASFLDKHVAEQ